MPQRPRLGCNATTSTSTSSLKLASKLITVGGKRVVFVYVLVAGSAACGDAHPPFVGTVSRSELFEYHDQVDEALCPTLLSQLDQHARQIGGLIGLAPKPSDPPFR